MPRRCTIGVVLRNSAPPERLGSERLKAARPLSNADAVHLDARRGLETPEHGRDVAERVVRDLLLSPLIFSSGATPITT